MKIFEHRSSVETARDPFEDDGEYGSDNNYEPSEEDSYSDSNLSESFFIINKKIMGWWCPDKKKDPKKSTPYTPW